MLQGEIRLTNYQINSAESFLYGLVGGDVVPCLNLAERRT